MKFQGGVKEAAKMLAGLTPKNRERVLEDIFKRDPRMAEELKKNMVIFEDLIYLTPKMMVELLREIKISDLALALRISSESLRTFFLNNVSSGIQKEIQEVLLGPPKQVSKVEESMENVMIVVRQKVDKGELVLRPDGEEYV